MNSDNQKWISDQLWYAKQCYRTGKSVKKLSVQDYYFMQSWYYLLEWASLVAEMEDRYDKP